MRITQATAQGPRPYQEDRVVVYKDKNGALLVAVFDGHGGSKTAQLCSEFITDFYHEYKKQVPQLMLYNIYKSLDLVTCTEISGSTASVVFVPPAKDKAYIAILGDSPVIVFDGETSISPEHNVRTNLSEREAAKKRGGVYANGYLFASFPSMSTQGLQMSRALGDHALRSVLNQQPEVYTVDLTNDSKILVASDGILDPAHAETESLLKSLRYMISYGAEADSLVNWAVNRGVFDNVTAVLLENWQEAKAFIPYTCQLRQEEPLTVAA